MGIRAEDIYLGYDGFEGLEHIGETSSAKDGTMALVRLALKSSFEAGVSTDLTKSLLCRAILLIIGGRVSPSLCISFLLWTGTALMFAAQKLFGVLGSWVPSFLRIRLLVFIPCVSLMHILRLFISISHWAILGVHLANEIQRSLQSLKRYSTSLRTRWQPSSCLHSLAMLLIPERCPLQVS